VIKELPIAGYSVVKERSSDLAIGRFDHPAIRHRPIITSSVVYQVGRAFYQVHLRAARYGGQPSPGLPTVAGLPSVAHERFQQPTFAKATVGILRLIMSEGWWRIPGSNR
jgi:hypothetical protein